MSEQDSASRLVLLLGETPDDPVRWAAGEGAELSAAGTAPNARVAASRLPPHDHLTAILPGEGVATRALRLPVPDRQAEGAARLALEDALAEPTEDLALAVGPAKGGDRLVSAAPRGWVRDWLAGLQAAGLDPDVIAADHACLGAEGHDGVVLRERGRVVARLPGGGLTAAEDFALPLIGQLAPDARLLSVRVGPSGAEIGAESLVLADERALGAFYLASCAREAPPSFRRGPLAKKRSGPGARGWRLAGALMAACFVLWLASGLVLGLRYQAAAEALRAEAQADYLEAFPGSRILDLRRQAEQRASGGASGTFLPLSAALASAMEETGAVQLTGLTYGTDGRLTAELRYRDFAELERLTDNLRARGLAASEGASPRREEDGAYTDRLTLEARS